MLKRLSKSVTLCLLRRAAAAWLALLGLTPAVDGARGLAAQGPDEGLLVLAASSLIEVLPRIAGAWQAGGHGPVRFSFDATSRLAAQAVEAAEVDVFVSADRAWIDWLLERGVISPDAPRALAGNEIVAVARLDRPLPGDPRALVGIARIALAGENVPAGRYAQRSLEAIGVWEGIRDAVVRGGSVRSVLEWVARGEVDVGFVYRTDARTESRVHVGFTLRAPEGDRVEYWAAPLMTARRPEAARGFVDFLTGPEGIRLLAEAGFTEAPRGETRQAPVPRDAVPSIRSAVRLSLLVAALSTVIGFLPALGLGWVLARVDFRGKAMLSTAVLVPLVIPPVVTGFLLLSLLGMQSPLGRALAAAGVPVPFTLVGATLAAWIVGFPLYVLSVRGAFEAVDPQFEELSWTLGVPPRRTFVRISLPLALPGIAAGAVLAFARSLGEFGATVVLAGNVEGSTRTIALAVYTLLESPSGRQATWTLVGASIGLSLVALLTYETLSRRQRRRLDDRHGT